MKTAIYIFILLALVVDADASTMSKKGRKNTQGSAGGWGVHSVCVGHDNEYVKYVNAHGQYEFMRCVAGQPAPEL